MGITIVFLSSSIFNYMLETLAIIKDGMQKIRDREKKYYTLPSMTEVEE